MCLELRLQGDEDRKYLRETLGVLLAVCVVDLSGHGLQTRQLLVQRSVVRVEDVIDEILQRALVPSPLRFIRRFDLSSNLREHRGGIQPELVADLRERLAATAAEVDVVAGEDPGRERMIDGDHADGCVEFQHGILGHHDRLHGGI